jgi:hypothetical protein
MVVVIHGQKGTESGRLRQEKAEGKRVRLSRVESTRGVLSARPPLLNHLQAAVYGRLITHLPPQLPAVASSSSSSCPFFPSSLFSPSAISLPPVHNPYQLPLPCLLFNGSISQAFSQAPQPHPSRMLRLVMITPPVLSSFSAVNLKASFRSNRLTCPSSFLDLIRLAQPFNLSPLVSTLTPSPGPPPHLKVERLPLPLPQEVPPSGAVILQQASMSLFLL